ncbi:MAG: hypothetical protein ACQESC_02945, partial [Nanobdellota archaeon]
TLMEIGTWSWVKPENTGDEMILKRFFEESYMNFNWTYHWAKLAQKMKKQIGAHSNTWLSLSLQNIMLDAYYCIYNLCGDVEEPREPTIKELKESEANLKKMLFEELQENKIYYNLSSPEEIKEWKHIYSLVENAYIAIQEKLETKRKKEELLQTPKT